MQTITISRYGYMPTHTPGEIIVGPGVAKFFATIEPAWSNNVDNVSCIPEGKYRARRFASPKHGTVWQLDDVPGRENIQIHVLNFAHQTEGCIGLGLRHEIINREAAVAESSRAVLRFNELLRNEEEIEIVIQYKRPTKILASEWQ